MTLAVCVAAEDRHMRLLRGNRIFSGLCFMRLCAGRISAILTSLGRGAVRAGLWLAIALVLGLGVSACSGKKSADLAFKEELGMVPGQYRRQQL